MPRHVASVLPAPPASSCVCRQGKAQARSRSQRGGRGARRTHQSATFHGAFFALPPRFSAWPPCSFALSRGKSESRKRLITKDEEDGAGPGRRNRARHTHSMMICERPTSSAVWQARPAPYLKAKLSASHRRPRPFRAPPNPPPPPASVHTGARQSATPARRLPREPLLRGRLRRAPPFPVPSGGGLRAGRRSVPTWVDLSLVRNPKLARVDSSGSEFVPAICFKNAVTDRI